MLKIIEKINCCMLCFLTFDLTTTGCTSCCVTTSKDSSYYMKLWQLILHPVVLNIKGFLILHITGFLLLLIFHILFKPPHGSTATTSLTVTRFLKPPQASRFLGSYVPRLLGAEHFFPHYL